MIEDRFITTYYLESIDELEIGRYYTDSYIIVNAVLVKCIFITESECSFLIVWVPESIEMQTFDIKKVKVGEIVEISSYRIGTDMKIYLYDTNEELVKFPDFKPVKLLQI